jgi:hypothetical protein
MIRLITRLAGRLALATAPAAAVVAVALLLRWDRPREDARQPVPLRPGERRGPSILQLLEHYGRLGSPSPPDTVDPDDSED